MRAGDHIQSLLMERHDNPDKDELCKCGQGLKRVRCRWDGCHQYPTSCAKCFIEYHRFNPLHWALVWDTTKGIWIKHDYSDLEGKPAIKLGHADDEGYCSGGKPPVDFIITHTNGVHETKVQFCGCPPQKEKVDQLIQSDLFPATITNPRSAFTLAVLRQFRMHNLQSKCGAYDFVMSLRRLTNSNLKTVNVSAFLLYLNLHSYTPSGPLQELPSMLSVMGCLCHQTMGRRCAWDRISSPIAVCRDTERILPILS